MPDDEKATEQEPEEIKDETSDEGEAAFAEDITDEEEQGKKEEKPVEDKGKKKEAEKKAEEKGKEEKSEKEKEAEEKKGEEKEEKELSAKEKLDKRLESVGDEEEEETPPAKKEQEPEKKKEEEPEKKPKEELKPAKLNKELLAERLSLISKDDLPEEVIIGDETVNLKQYAEDYPDDFAAIRVLSSLVAEKMVDKAVKGIEMPETGKITERVDVLEAGIAQLSFNTGVMQVKDDEGNVKHPDFYDIVYGSGMKDFHAWVKEQSPKIQKLASSLDPEDGILILDYYKEDVAKKKTTEHDKKTKDKKKEYDDIYKSEKSKRKNQQESGGGEKSPDEEAEEAFKEEE